MNSRLEKYEQRLAASQKLERIKKYLSLFGIGFTLWINDLWNMALKHLEAFEKKWFYRLSHLFGDKPPNVSPLLEFLNTVSFVIFLAFTAWLVYWAYMDTYVRTAQGESTWTFRNKVFLGVLVNAITYALLRITTNAVTKVA